MSSRRINHNIPAHSCLEESIVVDSRLSKCHQYIRRRRECKKCKIRFTTREADVETYLTEHEQVDHKETLLKMAKQLAKIIKTIEEL